MTTNLEAVRAKIIEAVPEIVELNFGCELLVKHDYGDPEKYVVCNIVSDDEIELSNVENRIVRTLDPSYLLSKLTEKVIGRPITLADVLRAMQKHCNELYGVRPSTTDRGEAAFMFFDDKAVQCETVQMGWNLALSLDEQEPEVIDFLHKILV